LVGRFVSVEEDFC